MIGVVAPSLYWSRYLIALTLFGSGVLLSANISPGNRQAGVESRYSATDSAEFEVSFAGGRVQIRGHSASRDHENTLVQLARQLFDEYELDLRPLVAMRDGWPEVTASLLTAVASSESAVALLANDAAHVRAVVSDLESWQERFGAFRSGLRPGVSVLADVIDVPHAPIDSCVKAYEYIRAARIVFDRASAALRSSMHGILDRHVEFALDCTMYGIAVTGHTDNRGDEPLNKALSLSRARAVADYLVGRGVPAERVFAAGAGSSEPIATNETAWGRVRNRRIEFELREIRSASL